MAASKPTNLQLTAPNPTVGVSLLAMAASKPTNLQLNTTIPTLGASLLAMAARQPTHYLQTACIPCGSWLASDGGLAVDYFLIELRDRRLRYFGLKTRSQKIAAYGSSYRGCRATLYCEISRFLSATTGVPGVSVSGPRQSL